MNKNNIVLGYSLIELLIVLSIFSILVMVATQTLVISLQNASKSESISKVKENVEYAMTVMERQLRNAREIVACPNPSTDAIEYLTYEGVTTGFACINTGTDGYIASGDTRLTNENISVTSCSIRCVFTPGAAPYVNIQIEAEDKDTFSGSAKNPIYTETQVLLRSF